MTEPMPRVLLISTYDLGRQPFGLASPAAWLRERGHEVTCADVSRERLADGTIRGADAVGLYLPMHTATRLALPLLARIRAANPAARLCAFGLYAPLNADGLRRAGVDAVFGGEFESDLAAWMDGHQPPEPAAAGPARLIFKVPDRSGLPALSRYAALQMPDGSRRLAGYTEASRGCKHRCRHCPIVPVYDGRFRVVSPDVVLADIRAQVQAGAQHVTFGDPDFFNGIRHARTIVEALAREWPGLTYDVTIKVEHLLAHADALPRLAATGCLFVTTAVESTDDRVLARLRKGHTRADVERVVDTCRASGLTLAPTFLPFTPWTTAESYSALLRDIARLGLVEQVSPVQLAIRLLIPAGSSLLELEEIRRVIGPYDPDALAYPWRHPEPRVDALQQEIEAIVGSRTSAPRRETFARVWAAAHRERPEPVPDAPATVARAAVPFLTEPWYC